MKPQTQKSNLTGSGENPRSDAEPLCVPPGFEELAYVFRCSYGHYPWDDWERAALAAGVDKDLAGLGRLTMREAFQHGWDARLKSLCGWRDQGRRMIKLALRSPETARKRWNRLLDTDGYRGEYDEQTGEWVSWI
jgi:hypothetical protein